MNFILLENNSIFIHKDDFINPIFIKVNSYLLKKYKNSLEELYGDSDKNECLYKLWKREFDADVIIEDSIPKILKFKSQNDLILFLFRVDSLL